MSDTYCICVRVDDAYADQTSTCLIRRAIALTLEQHKVAPDTGVTLLVTNDDDVRKLNRRFRGVDAPTDVLSFPTMDEESGEHLPPGFEEDPYLGDILIAFPYTAEHAQEDGHDLEHVLALLAVHGTLHLLGYDHDTAVRQAKMWTVQEMLLEHLAVPATVIPPQYDFSLEDVE